jgi:hypothetical protein
MTFVAIKMGRRQGARRAHPAPLFCSRGQTEQTRNQKSGAGRNRRAAQPPAHFHRNPLGRGQLAVFPRCSLLTYRFRYARRSRLEKQPTDLRRKTCYFGDRTPGREHPSSRFPDRIGKDPSMCGFESSVLAGIAANTYEKGYSDRYELP